VPDVFAVRLTVRDCELNRVGHVSHDTYHRYAEHARLELFRSAGCSLDRLLAEGMAPALLESHIWFRKELTVGDEVEVTCVPTFGAGKTFALGNTITHDGVVSAEITCTLGLIDLTARKLLPGPRDRLTALAAEPHVLLGNTARE